MQQSVNKDLIKTISVLNCMKLLKKSLILCIKSSNSLLVWKLGQEKMLTLLLQPNWKKNPATVSANIVDKTSKASSM